MKKILVFLLALLFTFPAIAEESVSELLERTLGIDVETADTQTLKSVVEGIDISIRPYLSAIEYCLERLDFMGEAQWVEKYREEYPNNLSGLSYDDLVLLKDRINLAMWERQEWQEVTVPKGVYLVGTDIPAGHWTIRTEAISCSIEVTDKLDETGKRHDWSGDVWSQSVIHAKGDHFDPTSDIEEVDYMLQNGWYVIIEYGSAIFTPYTGKPSLGFK